MEVCNQMLMHVCCAPCLANTRTTMQADGPGRYPELSGIFFYNPNIHPLLEFRRRHKALQVYLERDRLSAEIDSRYGLREYLAAVGEGGGVPANRRDRCYRCYRMRFDRVAAKCVADGVGAFTTTLLSSREQDLDLIVTAGREAALGSNLEFVVGDFRRVPAGPERLRGMYRQQYCGCVFSEEERYRGTSKHLYFPDARDSGV